MRSQTPDLAEKANSLFWLILHLHKKSSVFICVANKDCGEVHDDFNRGAT